jgi:hypothetical protein
MRQTHPAAYEDLAGLVIADRLPGLKSALRNLFVPRTAYLGGTPWQVLLDKRLALSHDPKDSVCLQYWNLAR